MVKEISGEKITNNGHGSQSADPVHHKHARDAENGSEQTQPQIVIPEAGSKSFKKTEVNYRSRPEMDRGRTNKGEELYREIQTT